MKDATGMTGTQDAASAGQMDRRWDPHEALLREKNLVRQVVAIYAICAGVLVMLWVYTKSTGMKIGGDLSFQDGATGVLTGSATIAFGAACCRVQPDQR